MVLSLALFSEEVHVWLGGGARYLPLPATPLTPPCRLPQYKLPNAELFAIHRNSDDDFKMCVYICTYVYDHCEVAAAA